MNDLSPVLKRKVLRDDVYDVLLQRLLSGKYEPGAPLSIDGLAREFGVSPTPVREAMVHLEQTGLVTRAALKGYRLAPPLSLEQMSQIVDTRRVLEVAAIERAMKNAERMIPQLEAVFENHVEYAQKVTNAQLKGRLTIDDLQPYFDADWAFHQVILDHCENPYISKMAGSMSFSIHRMRQNILDNEVDVQFAVEEHQQVLTAIKSRDVVRVRHAMESHLINVLDRTAKEAKK